MKKKNKEQKQPKDMRFEEIMNLLNEKEFKEIKFEVIKKPFESWDQFLEEYASGQEIHKQWMGILEFTFIWKGEDRYPFAYVFPKLETEDGYYFYIQLNS